MSGPHDALRSWVPVPEGSDFPIQNLPYGVFRTARGSRHVGVAIGDHVLDLADTHAGGGFDGIEIPGWLFAGSTLNEFMELGPDVWRSVRRRIVELLREGSSDRAAVEEWIVPCQDVEMLLPIDVGDYVDFYSSLNHASNIGKMFRPGAEPLLPNWRHMPIAYHGRASTIIVSGTPVRRPHGQRRGPEGPTFGPSQRLDIELEVGFVTGVGSGLGATIPVSSAEDHIFGMCLVNDWSARDIQAWEYQPLGPFLGKSFATTISPWIVPMEALRPFRVTPPAQDPPPLPYLATEGSTALALDLEIELNGEVVARTTFRDMYWTMSQQLAHAAVNGTAIRPGDLYASGTVSGPTPDSCGSLIEMTWNGTEPLTLADGRERTFLADGDRVALRGRCTAEGAVPIGFGECAGTIVAAED